MAIRLWNSTSCQLHRLTLICISEMLNYLYNHAINKFWCIVSSGHQVVFKEFTIFHVYEKFAGVKKNYFSYNMLCWIYVKSRPNRIKPNSRLNAFYLIGFSPQIPKNDIPQLNDSLLTMQVIKVGVAQQKLKLFTYQNTLVLAG